MFEVGVRHPSGWLIARAFAGALGSASLLAPRDGFAQVLPPTLLEYQTPDECPSASDFQASVQRRSARIRFVDEGSHERELSIVIRRNGNGNGVQGELRLLETDGTLRQRSVHFSNCQEAVDGLALIATVSLDPRVLEQASPTAASADPNATPPPAPHTAGPTLRATLPPNVDARPHSSGARAGFGAEFSSYFNALPATAIGGSAFFDLTLGQERVWSPRLRVSFTHVERRDIELRNGRANFSLTVGRLFLCPLRLGNLGFESRPCLTASGGALHASSFDTVESRSKARPFWSLGASVMAALRIAEPFEVTLDIGLHAALLRDRFVLAGSEFWRTPSGYFDANLGFRLLP